MKKAILKTDKAYKITKRKWFKRTVAGLCIVVALLGAAFGAGFAGVRELRGDNRLSGYSQIKKAAKAIGAEDNTFYHLREGNKSSEEKSIARFVPGKSSTVEVVSGEGVEGKTLQSLWASVANVNEVASMARRQDTFRFDIVAEKTNNNPAIIFSVKDYEEEKSPAAAIAKKAPLFRGSIWMLLLAM